MSGTSTATARASARLRTFSVVVSSLAIVLIGGITALVAVNTPAISGTPAIVTSEDFYYPYENPDPTIAQRDGSEWSAAGQAMIPLTGLTPGEVLLIDYDRDGPIDDVFLTAPEAATPPGLPGPPEYSTYTDALYVVPSLSEMELWIDTYETDPWTLTVSEPELEQRTGSAGGIGAGAFVYVGDASSARVTIRSDSGVSMRIVTQAGEEALYDSYEDGDSASVAWPDTASAVFVVEAYDEEAAWSVEFYEPSPTATSTPVPAEPEGAGDE